MASGDTLYVWEPKNADSPASATAAAIRTTINTTTPHPCLEFSASVDQSAILPGVMPQNYAGGGVTMHFWCSAPIATNNFILDGFFERTPIDTQVLTSDSFAAAQSVTDAAPSATDRVVEPTIAHTSGAQMDSVVAGDMFRYKITRDADNASDNMAAVLRILRVEMRET